jgi:uncharacterized RDD family membrane protein YckC
MQHKAGLGLRVAATLLDLALFLPLYFAAVFALTKLWGDPGDRMWDLNPVRLSATVGNVMWLAYSSLEWLAGRTPGKMLLRMKITADDGSPAARAQLFLRWAAKQSPRIFGVLDAITVTWAVRMLIAKSGLAVFYHEPMNFKLARDVGELLAYIILFGFLLTLRANRRSLHDLLTGTAVYQSRPALAKRGFEPVTEEQRPLMVQPLESRDMI